MLFEHESHRMLLLWCSVAIVIVALLLEIELCSSANESVHELGITHLSELVLIMVQSWFIIFCWSMFCDPG